MGFTEPESANLSLRRFLPYRILRLLLGLQLALLFSFESFSFAQTAKVQESTQQDILQRASAAWEHGDVARALEILDESNQADLHSMAVSKLRGDILSSSRRQQDAVKAYDSVLADNPAALDIRWAKRGVLIRSGDGEGALAELQQIAGIDADNPLIHLELARELRILDRLEESLDSYKKAVELAPELLSWRLAMARAKFDVLDYQGAYQDVNTVLQRVPPGSPLEVPAKNLLSVIDGNGRERGRRFERIYTPPEVTADKLKEWALIRAEAWNLFSVGRYEEAIPIYQRLIALNPTDSVGIYQLGISLVQVGRCEDAVAVFKKMTAPNSSDELYADMRFRMGQCLVKMEQWEEAYFNFQLLYDSALEFEKTNKGVQLPPGTRVLDKNKLAAWIETVRPHLPEIAELKPIDGAATQGDPGANILTPEQLYAKAMEELKPQKFLETRTALMGRDADFSWFRFVIPAAKVLRDDFPTGAHEFIPLNPSDTFPTTQRDIYLVFGLVSASYDAIPLTAQCFIEASEFTGEQKPVAQDQVVMSMNDQSGYFMLSRPENGWRSGLYRCGLFEGDKASAYANVDEVRFRIIDQPL